MESITPSEHLSLPPVLHDHQESVVKDPHFKSRITWRRAFDFTLTVVGYTVGVHDFWRFPYQCYKYGGSFYIPYLLFMFIFYFPGVFVEFTIGQHYALGATEVFSELAPILTGVSYILAWNSLTSCWLYAMMITWSRLYSDDATSCKQGWHTCSRDNYYNTERCFTGVRDLQCARLAHTKLNHSLVDDYSLYYNFTCYGLDEFCKIHNATPVPTKKSCIVDPNDQTTRFSIFDKREHASSEYFYGLCGLRKNFSNATTKGYLYQKDMESASENELLVFSFTTFAIIAFFLHEGLLAVSLITYALNAVPFIALAYFTVRALTLEYSLFGVQELFTRSGFENLREPQMWVDAVMQVICSTGIGNGVLINLSTFNKHDHNFIFDTSIAALLNTICSTCATLICFCAISNVKTFNMMEDIGFREFIVAEADYSSLEFGYITYTLFLTIIKDDYLSVMLFFFMITSFSMDSALRLIQNTLDAMTSLFPRLRRHRLASLSAICLFGFAAVLPMTRNGGVLLFLDYEYFMVRFVWPIIVLFQLVGVTWIFGASRIMDHCEQIDLVCHISFRYYIIACLQYFMPFMLLFVLIYNVYSHFSTVKFMNEEIRGETYWNDAFGWVLTLSPILIMSLSVADNLLKTEKARWSTLFEPSFSRGAHSNRKRTGLSITNYGNMAMERDSTKSIERKSQGNVLKALSKWRGGKKFGKKQQGEGIQDEEEQKRLSINTNIVTSVMKQEMSPGGSNATWVSDGVLSQSALPGNEDKTSQKKESIQPGDAKPLIDEDMANEYSLLLEQMDASILRNKWKSIIDYLDKWPGRFEEVEEIESDSEDSEYGVTTDSGSDTSENNQAPTGTGI